MKYKTIKITQDTILGVIGDIHEHEEQFNEIVENFKPSEKRILISVGDIYEKGFGIDKAESITDTLKKFNEEGYGYVVSGNHDYKLIRKAIRGGKDMSPQLQWIETQPWSISFKYPNGKSILVLHGGVTPKHKAEDLSNSEIMYVRTVDSNGDYIPMKRRTINGKTVLGAATHGPSWHEVYDGRFGYICAGHDAQKDGKVKYYKYSCNIDTACYHTGILTCQTFDQKGLVETLHSYGIPSGFTPS